MLRKESNRGGKKGEGLPEGTGVLTFNDRLWIITSLETSSPSVTGTFGEVQHGFMFRHRKHQSALHGQMEPGIV